MELTTNIINYNYDIQSVLLKTLIICCLGYYLKFLWTNRNMYIMSWNHPGPINLPLIGAAYHFIGRPEDFLPKILKLYKKFSSECKIWFGSGLIYLVIEPENVEKLLTSPKYLQKKFIYKQIAQTVGDGLLTAAPNKWKKHRKIISPFFNQRVLNSYVEIFAEKGSILTEVMAKNNNYGKIIDNIQDIIGKCTLDMISETAMGVKLNVQKTNSSYYKTFDNILIMIQLRLSRLWNHFEFIWKLVGHEAKLQKILKQFNGLTDHVIQEKIAATKQRKIDDHYDDYEEDIAKRKAFLEYMVETEKFTQLELREEVNILFLAAVDTSTITLTSVFSMLGMFPDIQEKVYEEIIEIMGKERLPEYKDLSYMVYTERVIKETLRLFPSAPYFLRHFTEDVDMGTYVIPKGAAVMFPAIIIHREARFWPNPLKFDPDRFLPDEVAKRHPCTYIPFSYGPRNCIGWKYGIMGIKTIIASVVRKFRIHCEYKNIEEIRVTSRLLLRFRDGAKVSISPRE